MGQTRRQFLQTGIALGSGLAIGSSWLDQSTLRAAACPTGGCAGFPTMTSLPP